MDTIRNYLDTTFNSFPKTEAIEDVKAEMLEMMEEKFQELRNEGKPEHEAIAIVISEFGNMDELRETLGINDEGEVDYYNEEDIHHHIQYSIHATYMIAVGVSLIIMSFVFPILNSEDKIGPAIMFVFWAMGVGLFVIAGNSKSDSLNNRGSQLSDEVRRKLTDQRNKESQKEAVILAVGIMLCVVSVIPTILFENSPWAHASLVAIIAVGVGLIILSGAKKRAYDELFKNKKRQGAVLYKNVKVRKIMSVYWPTVTCLYICYSFLTFEWYRSWIIWPIAAAINALIRAVFSEEGNNDA